MSKVSFPLLFTFYSLFSWACKYTNLLWSNLQKIPQPRVSPQQREAMLAFMMAHEDLARGRVTGPDAVRHKAKLLQEMTTTLNSIGSGATKTPDKWLKVCLYCVCNYILSKEQHDEIFKNNCKLFQCWMDWRCDVKAKALKIRKYCEGTGGGPGPSPLTQMEETLLQFCGIEMVLGVEDVQDPLEVTKEPLSERVWIALHVKDNLCHHWLQYSRKWGSTNIIIHGYISNTKYMSNTAYIPYITNIIHMFLNGLWLCYLKVPKFDLKHLYIQVTDMIPPTEVNEKITDPSAYVEVEVIDEGLGERHHKAKSMYINVLC